MKVWILLVLLSAALLLPSIEPLSQRMRQRKVVLPTHADNIKMWQSMSR